MSGTVSLGQTEMRVAETAGVIQVEIARAGSLGGAVTVTYGITPANATPGLDYSVTGSSIVIPDGVASITVPVTILDDSLGEPTEVLTFAIVSADGAALTAPRTTRISILDDETPAPPPPTEPPVFSDFILSTTEVVTGLNAPVRFAFNPIDPNQIFIIEKGGLVRVSDLASPATTSAVFLDISDRVNAAHDRGLLGIALHPDFAANPYVYLYYVVDPPEAATLGGEAAPDQFGNRYAVVERFTADAATGYSSIVAGSGVVLLGGGARGMIDVNGGGFLDFNDPTHSALAASDRYINPADPSPPALVRGFKQDFIKADGRSHNGGAMLFGPDGALYLATGDAVSFNYSDPRAVDVLSPDSLSGKILRIDPLTGLGLPDNPFALPGIELDENRAKVFQLGLRNPFSFAIDDDGRVVIADVGQGSFEEINIAGPGANFGWPFFEGGDGGTFSRTPGYQGLPTAAAFYDAVAAGEITITPAFRAFSHDSGAPGYRLQAIIGGSFVYDGTQYDASFQDDFLFTDFNNGHLFSIDVNDTTAVRYLGDLDGLIHLGQGGDGFIYLANIYGGTISRLEIAAAPPFVQPVQEIVGIGSAVLADSIAGEWRLTPEDAFRAGGAVGSTRIDLRQDARFVFDYRFGANDGGADGGGFALHNDTAGMRALGRSGGDLGLFGLTNAIAVEFDTWQNDDRDLVNDHARIFAPNSDAFGQGVNGLVDLGNIEDGQWHRIEVTWTAATGTLAYSFDGTPRDSRTGGIIETALAGSHFAYFLVTGATGGVNVEHRMRLISADVTFENIAEAQAPWMLGGQHRQVAFAENGEGVILSAAATDAEGDAISWRILAGGDGALFTIDAASGALRFREAPDFEAPADADADNSYQLTIEASDAGGLAATQRITVTVTDVDPEEIRGTDGAESLMGTLRGNLMIGLGGNDTVRAGDGDDTILATLNDGNDFYHGGAGIGDTFSLGATGAARVLLHQGRAIGAQIGADTLRGIEHATGGAGNDSLGGNAGSNRLRGEAGADSLAGADGDDILEGGAGADTLDGGRDADRAVGGDGSDLYVIDDGDDVVVELAGGGADTIRAFVSLTLPDQVEALLLLGAASLEGQGNGADNIIFGNAGDNRLAGGDGADTVNGGAGADTILAGAGADRLEGGTGNDIFLFNAPSDGADTILRYAGLEDTLLVSAAGFGGGLAAGMDLLATGRYVANLVGTATAPAGTGQFVYDTNAFTLSWDADGSGAGAALLIARFSGARGWSGSEIAVIA